MLGIKFYLRIFNLAVLLLLLSYGVNSAPATLSFIARYIRHIPIRNIGEYDYHEIEYYQNLTSLDDIEEDFFSTGNEIPVKLRIGKDNSTFPDLASKTVFATDFPSGSTEDAKCNELERLLPQLDLYNSFCYVAWDVQAKNSSFTTVVEQQYYRMKIKFFNSKKKLLLFYNSQTTDRFYRCQGIGHKIFNYNFGENNTEADVLFPFPLQYNTCLSAQYMKNGICYDCPEDSTVSSDHTTCICNKKGIIIDDALTICKFSTSTQIYPVYGIKLRQNLGWLQKTEFIVRTALSYDEALEIYDATSSSPKAIIDNYTPKMHPAVTSPCTDYSNVATLDTFPFNPNFYAQFSSTCPIHKYLLNYSYYQGNDLVVGFQVSTGKDGQYTCTESSSVSFSPDFTTKNGWLDHSDLNGYGIFTPNADGVAKVQGILGTGNDSAPFSRLGGYSVKWTGTWIVSIDIFFDLSDWPLGTGFYYTVASNRRTDTHLRDFVFMVTKDTSLEKLLIAVSNNTGSSPRENLETLNHYWVQNNGWYTFQHRFFDLNNALAVEMTIKTSDGEVVFSQILSQPTDIISGDAGIVGGNRYAWFTRIFNTNGFLIRNNTKTEFGFPYPNSLSGCDYVAARSYECSGSSLELKDVYFKDDNLNYYASHMPKYVATNYSLSPISHDLRP